MSVLERDRKAINNKEERKRGVGVGGRGVGEEGSKVSVASFNNFM